MPSRARAASPPPTPTFVFRGTVREAGTTMKNVPADARTAIVHVDEVIESPKDLLRLAGQEITVQMTGRVPKGGAALVFHTVPLMFGESVLVKSTAQEPVPRAGAVLSAAPGADPVERKEQRELDARVQDADVVVSGRVKSVELPPEPSAPAVAAAGAVKAKPIRPISEHDPRWRDAIVEVDAVHKGTHAPRTITVRFPASRDVRWYKAPKFEPGQHGMFVLHKVAVSDAPAPAGRGMAATGGTARTGPDVYMALHPADFQPDPGAPAVRSAVASAAVAKKPVARRAAARKTAAKKAAAKKPARRRR
jgi:hypothetical protein